METRFPDGETAMVEGKRAHSYSLECAQASCRPDPDDSTVELSRWPAASQTSRGLVRFRKSSPTEISSMSVMAAIDNRNDRVLVGDCEKLCGDTGVGSAMGRRRCGASLEECRRRGRSN